MSSFPADSGRLSGERWNYRRDRLVAWYFETKKMMVEALLHDGFAPFTEDLARQPLLLYMKLLALQQSGQLTDPRGLAQLQQLAQRYGNPQPTRLNPLAGEEYVSPGAQQQAAFRAQGPR